MALPEHLKELISPFASKKEAKGGIYPFEPIENDNIGLIILVAEIISDAVKGPGIDAYDLAEYIVAVVLQGGE